MHRSVDLIHYELLSLREMLKAEEQLRDSLVEIGFAQLGSKTKNMLQIEEQIQSRIEELKRLGVNIQGYVPATIRQALQVLGLPTNSIPSDDQLKNAYRALAMKHHPDRGGDQRQMQKIITAYNAVRAEK